MANANWPASERASWEAFSRQKDQGLVANRNGAANGNGAVSDSGAVNGRTHLTVSTQRKGTSAPLSKLEKQWLKTHFGDEFHLLRDYHLSIYKEEDRDEGRSILRALMKNDDSDDDPGCENSFLRELEEDSTSHVADYHFSENELDWIKKKYQHSGNFLRSFGLKPFDDGDCREGKALIHSMMKQ